MSELTDGDAKYHYTGGSHRWIAPNDGRWSQESWEAAVEQHLQAHRDAEFGPVKRRRVGDGESC